MTQATEKMNPFDAQDLQVRIGDCIQQYSQNPYWMGKWSAILTPGVLSLEWAGDIDLYGAYDQQAPWTQWGGNLLLSKAGVLGDPRCVISQETMLSHTGDPYWQYAARWSVAPYQTKIEETEEELVFKHD